MTQVRSRVRTRSADDTPLRGIMDQIGDRFGENVVTLGAQMRPCRHLPTGVFTLDMGLLGGFPQNHTNIVVGWEGSGKTTLAQRLLASAQRLYPDFTPALIDVEHTYDPAWGAIHGIDNERLLYVTPDSGEAAADICEALLEEAGVSLVVLDSIAALLPLKERESSHEDSTVALQARLVGKLLRKANAAINERKKLGQPATLVAINQWRSKITTMGDPRTMPGGTAIRFFAHCIVEVMRRKEHLGKDARDIETVTHNDHAFRIHKSKGGVSLRTGEFQMIRSPDHPLGQGWIDDARTVITYAKKFGLITGGGQSWRLDGLDEAFPRLAAIEEHFYSDLDLFEQTKTRLIEMQREHARLPREFL